MFKSTCLTLTTTAKWLSCLLAGTMLWQAADGLTACADEVLGDEDFRAIIASDASAVSLASTGQIQAPQTEAEQEPAPEASATLADLSLTSWGEVPACANGACPSDSRRDALSCSSSCFSSGRRQSRTSRLSRVPNMIGDAGLGVPRVFGTATQVIHFPDHFSKISQNNSPLPQNRLSFDYTHLSGLQGTSFAGGVGDRNLDGNAFRFGFERAFQDGLFSLEFQIPFYESIGSEVDDADFNDIGDVEFGNLVFGFKTLLASAEQGALSAGIRFEAPTREDQEGITADVVISRNTWFFQPYAAGVVERNGWFAQGFTGVRLRSGQEETSVGGVPVTGFDFITRNLFYADLGVGRVIDFQNRRWLQSVSPTIELHYLQGIEGGDPLLLTEAIFGPSVDQLNLTAGFTATFHSQATLSIAAVAPLRRSTTVTTGLAPGLIVDTDRLTDAQVSIQLNLFRR